MNRKPTRKDVIRAVKKARNLSLKASYAAADADSMVATYWQSDLRPFLISEDYRETAKLSVSIATTLWLMLERNLKSPTI